MYSMNAISGFFVGWCYYQAQILFEPTTPLIDKIDVNNWAIDDIEELEDFRINPPSSDVKQAHILEKEQD